MAKRRKKHGKTVRGLMGYSYGGSRGGTMTTTNTQCPPGQGGMSIPTGLLNMQFKHLAGKMNSNVGRRHPGV